MSLPIPLNFQTQELFNNKKFEINIYAGLTVLLGPNGSGKTQFLRQLKAKLSSHISEKKIRYLSAGRLYHLENYRSDYDGRRGQPNYDNASFGGKDMRNYRHNSETAFGDFHTLSIRPDIQIKVAERLRNLFKRDVFLDWDAGNLTINFKRTDSEQAPYSSAREASGLLQLVVILSAIYDDEVGALLIDELEVSLHPQLQSFLFKEIKKVAGDSAIKTKKIIVIATHSTEFVELKKATDVSNIIFFKDISTVPSQISPNSSVLRNKKLKTLLSRIGHSYRRSLFCSRPLLVEGPSDVIICNALETKFDLNLDAAGSQAVSVIGKGQMPIVSKFFRLIGKYPILMADLDAFADNLDLINSLEITSEVKKLVNRQGHSSLKKMARDIYNDFCRIVNEKWKEISLEAQQHSYWQNNCSSEDELIARRRSSLAVLLNCDSNYLNTLDGTWSSIKLRIESLFEILESNSCFFLRKGAIENYFLFANNIDNKNKTEKAVEEMEGILNGNKRTLHSNYKEILNILIYASRSPKINEAKALSDLLLAIASPAISRLNTNPSITEIQSLAYNIIGERSSIFKIELENTENEGPTLIIDNNSKILEVDGFPISFKKNSNVVEYVKEKIKFSYSGRA